MITAASWADFGFRRLPTSALAVQNNRFADVLRNCGGYEVKEDQWIRHPGRVHPDRAVDVRVVSTCDTNDLANWSTDFIYDFFVWLDKHPEIGPRPHALIEHLIEVVEKAEESADKQPWRHLAKLGVALITCPSGTQFASVCKDLVLPSFFRHWPAGKVIFIRHSQTRLRMLAAMRSLYTNSLVPADAWKQDGVGPLEALQQWHAGDPNSLFLSVLGLAQTLWYPLVTAVLCDNFSLNALFVLDPPGQFKPSAYPSSWLAMFRRNAEFGLEDRDPISAIKDHPGPQYQQLAHRRPICTRSPSRAELDRFTEWLIPTIDRWIFNLCDVANYTADNNPLGEIDGLSAYEHVLTVERLVARIVDVATSTAVGQAKTVVFEIADLIAQLQERFLGPPTSGARFKDLFNPDVAIPLFSPALKQIPGVGPELATQLEQTYSELQRSVIASVWIKSKVTRNGVLVKDSKLASENEETFGAFTGNVLRTLRNGHHGYFTDQDDKQKRPSRYLALVTGEVPDSLVVLPALWFFAYLVDLRLFGWAPMSIGGYAA